MVPKRNKKSASAELQGVAEKVRRGVFESSVAEIQNELLKDPMMAAHVLHMIKQGLLKDREQDPANKLHKSQNKVCLVLVKHVKAWLGALKPGLKDEMRGCKDKQAFYQLLSFACRVGTHTALRTKCLDELQVKIFEEAHAAGSRLQSQFELKADFRPDWAKMWVVFFQRSQLSMISEAWRIAYLKEGMLVRCREGLHMALVIGQVPYHGNVASSCLPGGQEGQGVDHEH